MKMWKVREYCNPTILDKNTIMTDDWCFMNKELIQEQCKCCKKSICLQLVDLLDNKHIKEAEYIINNVFD